MSLILTKTLRLILLLLAFTSILFVSSCDKDEATPEPTKDELIQKTFTVGSTGTIMRDGVDVSDEFANMTLGFNSNGTYTSTNGGRVFRSSGTWAWNTDKSNMILDGDFPMDVVEVTETFVRLRFTLTYERAESNGRVSAVVGVYAVVLNH